MSFYFRITTLCILPDIYPITFNIFTCSRYEPSSLMQASLAWFDGVAAPHASPKPRPTHNKPV